MLYLQIHQGDLSHPVGVLKEYFHQAGTSIIRAAFSHSYFVHPDNVRERTPYFADRARFSRTHYPGAAKGQKAIWPGDGREIIVDDNQHAQLAWERYTGRGLLRGTGYSIRHIWGATLGSRVFHRRLEPLLHALLGRNAYRKATSSRRVRTGHPAGVLGPVFQNQPGLPSTGGGR